MAKISNPFASRSPSPGPSPLSATQRSFAPRLNVTNIEEAQRSERLTAEMQSGAENLAPRFKPIETKAPYETTAPVAIPVKPEAGGSNT